VNDSPRVGRELSNILAKKRRTGVILGKIGKSTAGEWCKAALGVRVAIGGQGREGEALGRVLPPLIDGDEGAG